MSAYGCRNLVPDILHCPFQVRYRPSMAAPPHGLSHIDHVDGGLLVSHFAKEMSAVPPAATKRKEMSDI